MRHLIRLLATAAVALAAFSGPAAARALVPPITPDRLVPYDSTSAYIAHEFGSADGHTYTNSATAFNASYAKGFRLFECDMLLLKDGTVVLAHDGTERAYGLDKPWKDATAADVPGKRYLGLYRLLTARDLVRLMRSHPDIRVIMDSKWSQVEIARQVVRAAHGDTDVLDRLIPHVFSYRTLLAMRQVYPFKATMLALYGFHPKPTPAQIIRMVRRGHATAVMMRASGPGGNERVFTPLMHAALVKAGIPDYVFGVPGGQSGVRAFRQLGVGVYSDGFFAPPASKAPLPARMRTPWLLPPDPEDDGA